MTREQLKTIFPNATGSFIVANQTGDTGTAPVVECGVGSEPLAAAANEKGDQGRVLVRVTSVRKRLLDEDNLCEKYHVDCCRYAGLLRLDSPEQTKIEVCQRKAEKDEAEHTVIELHDNMEPASVWVKAMPQDGNQWTIYGTKCYRSRDEAMRSEGLLLPFNFVELTLCSS